MTALSTRGFHSSAFLDAEQLPSEFLENAGMPGHSTVIISLFPFSTEDSSGLIAPFARRNHYKEIIKRMKEALKDAGPPFSDLGKKDLRFFSNSRFPEKDLALLGGLGFRGKNTLILNRDYGSRSLLGGVIIPLGMKSQPPDRLYNNVGCGQCRLCEEACPGGALKGYKLDKKLCLQHWTTEDGSVPDKLKDSWGRRIYGCTICQDVCPWNKKVKTVQPIELGHINPEPSLDFYLTESPENIKSFFKGSSLGMGWIKAEHLIRNAVLSIPFSGDDAQDGLRDKAERLILSEDEGIRDALNWIRKKD